MASQSIYNLNSMGVLHGTTLLDSAKKSTATTVSTATGKALNAVSANQGVGKAINAVSSNVLGKNSAYSVNEAINAVSKANKSGLLAEGSTVSYLKNIPVVEGSTIAIMDDVPSSKPVGVLKSIKEGPTTSGSDLDITFSQIDQNIATLKKAISTLKSAWDGETKKNLSTISNSWVGEDCEEYTTKLSKMDGRIQNTISALELLRSTYEKARDMVSSNQQNTITSIGSLGE